MPISEAEAIGKRLAEAGIIKGKRFANSRLKERSLESIPSSSKMKTDIAVAYALMEKGDENAPKIADLLLPYAKADDVFSDLAIRFSIKAAEQFLHATNFEATLNYYLKTINLDKNTQRKIKSLDQILRLEWMTSRWDDLIIHSKDLENLANENGDKKMKGVALFRQARVYHKKSDYDKVLALVNNIEKLSEEIEDTELKFLSGDQKAWVYLETKRTDEALKLLQDLLNIPNLGLKEKAIGKLSLAEAYIRTNKIDLAEAMQKETIKIFDTLGDEWGKLRTLYNVMNMSYRPNKIDEYFKYAGEVYILSQKLGDLFSTAIAMTAFSNYYLDTNQFKQCNEWLEKAEEINKKIDSNIVNLTIQSNYFELLKKSIIQRIDILNDSYFSNQWSNNLKKTHIEFADEIITRLEEFKNKKEK
jgi:tetratricopeptide (TPR) repeat protein